MQNAALKTDIVIFGGGVAGLWTLNRLKKLGFQVVLLEKEALGAGQTLQSQGIIHGGLKYALTGFLSRSAQTLQSMPNHWKEALTGVGAIDLRTVNLLSPYQWLWSTSGLSSKLGSFLASKALKSRVQKLQRFDYPSLLQPAEFKGHVYRLEEMIIDTSSLIKTLASPHQEYIFKIDDKEGYEFIFQPNNPQNISQLNILSGQRKLSIQAKRYLFTAGEGNEVLTAYLPKAPSMQKRPLQMVLVKMDVWLPFFGHCIDQGINPRITITSHRTQEGKMIWYIGGQIAEEGIDRTSAEQIAIAKKELAALFPWLDLSKAQWASFLVNRAEPKQLNNQRPVTVFIKALGNVIIAWPTKLVLAPLLAEEIISSLKQQPINPSPEPIESLLANAHLEKPSIALPPWERFFS